MIKKRLRLWEIRYLKKKLKIVNKYLRYINTLGKF